MTILHCAKKPRHRIIIRRLLRLTDLNGIMARREASTGEQEESQCALRRKMNLIHGRSGHDLDNVGRVNDTGRQLEKRFHGTTSNAHASLCLSLNRPVLVYRRQKRQNDPLCPRHITTERSDAHGQCHAHRGGQSDGCECVDGATLSMV